jgi:hypothetical protein
VVQYQAKVVTFKSEPRFLIAGVIQHRVMYGMPCGTIVLLFSTVQLKAIFVVVLKIFGF